MAYQPINKPIPKYFNGKKVWSYKRDCKDFEPYFFNRRYCKLEDSCRADGYHCEGFSGIMSRRKKLCTGITTNRWKEIIS